MRKKKQKKKKKKKKKKQVINDVLSMFTVRKQQTADLMVLMG